MFYCFVYRKKSIFPILKYFRRGSEQGDFAEQVPPLPQNRGRILQNKRFCQILAATFQVRLLAAFQASGWQNAEPEFFNF